MLGPVGARALSSARPTLVARAAVALQRRRNTDPIRTARPLSTEADGDAVNVLPTSKAWKAFMDDGARRATPNAFRHAGSGCSAHSL